MTPAPGSQAHPALGLATRLASIGAGTIAALAMVGWQFDLPTLRAPVPGSVAMNPATAVAFLLASLSLWVIHRAKPETASQPLAQICAAIVAAIGSLKLFSLLAGIDLPLDQVLFRDKLDDATPPNRMAPNTALAFALLGSGLLALGSRARRGWPAQPLLLVTLAMSLMALFGYLFGARSLYWISSFIPMAPNTAFAFLLLAAGTIITQPDSGICRLLLSPSPGGLMARRLLPAAIVVPVVLGWLRLEGQRRGLYQLEIGTALMALAIVGILVGLVLLTGRSLDAAERERRRIEEALRKSLERQSRLLEANIIGVLSANTEGWITEANPTFLNMIGYRREELPVKSETITPPEWRGLTETAKREIAERGVATPFEKEYVRRDGTRVPALVGAAALPGTDGEVLAFAVDLSGKKEAERKIEELHRALESRAEELEIANRELEAFSYSVSHDLRAPLRHISGFVDLLLRQNASQLDETGKRRLTAVSGSAQKMGELIDDLLVFSRMGRTEMQRSKVNLAALVQAIIADLEADTKGHHIRWVIGPLPEVEGDPPMLRLVLTNLVSNAIKYTGTREEAVIEIGVEERAGEGTVVFVRDNGVGFDMQYAGKLFGVFQRLHKHEEFPGTGIGLANVRRIIHRHGGKTWAEGALDQGATFYFSLPTHEEKEEERWAA